MVRLFLLLITMLTLAGCKDTGGGVVGYVNNALNRSVLSTAAMSISINEGSSHSLLIVLDHGVSRDTTLDWQVSAPNGQFVTKQDSVSLSEGQSSALITLDSVDNNVTDGHRSFFLTISGSSLVFANTITIQVTIVDNESAPLLSIANVHVAEGTGAGTSDAVFTVTASNPSTNNIVVNYATTDGTALDGVDYNGVSGTLTIPAGSLTGTITVPVIRDSVYEVNKDFNLTLSGGSGYTVTGSTLSAVGTIEDDESQSTLAIANVSVNEGTGGTTYDAVFTVTMANASSQNVTFNYATSNGSAVAGTDYTATTGTGTITAGSTTTTITVPITANALYELNKTFTVTLSGGTGYLTSGSTLVATGTIVNDDIAPTLSIANASVTEGNSGTSTLTFTVTASTASGAAISFNFATSNGSATAGTDYTTASGSGTIAAGATSTTINVVVAANTIYQSNRNLTMTLSGGSGYTAAGSTLSASGTITDDDVAPTISISNVSVTEGTGAGTTNAVFTVTTSALSEIPITFNYATSDGSALAGSDYIGTSGSATIMAGSSTATITVAITRDSLYEPTESFNMTLSGGSGYLVAGSLLNAIATITDDDIPPTISIGNINVTEGTGAGTTNATFTVTLASASGVNMVVNYATTAGTASSADFTTTSGTLTISAGSTTGTFTVPVVQDSLREADETFSVTLSGGSGYKVSGSTLTATATIEDDDVGPTISVANVSMAEGNSGTSNMTFTVTANTVSALPVSFNFATSDGTALSGIDYTATTGSKTIAAGATSTTFTVPVIGNTLFENSKAFTVTLSGGSDYDASGSTLSATGTITNDDVAPTISIGNISLVEGSGAGTTNANFTVTASAISGINITFSYATSDGTAIAGSDYTSTTGTGTILAGQTTTTVSVPITRDSTYEAAETFTMTLSGGSGYTASGSTLSATATITNDDAAAKVWDFQNLSDYTLDPQLNFATGAVTLKQVDTVTNTAAEFNAGSLAGVTVSGSSLKLDPSTANDMSYAANWTPKLSFLVGYWKFEGNWSDSSPSGVTMTRSAGASLSSPVVKSGTGAGVFSGTNWGNAVLPATYSNYSISVWAQPMSTQPNGGVISQAGSGSPAIGMDASNYWTFGSVTTNIKSPTATWTHLVAVQNGSTQTLYVNGVLAGSATASSSLSAVDVARVASATTSIWVDELGVFSTPLNAADVSLVYNRQRSKYNGLYTSAVTDMGSGVPWYNLTPITTQPFLKELASTNETSQPGLMTGIAGLWHFNETALDTVSATEDFADLSGNGNHGLKAGGTMNLGVTTVFGRGIQSDASAYLTLPLGTTLLPAGSTTGVTFSIWHIPSNLGSETRLLMLPKSSTSTAVGLAVNRPSTGRVTMFYQDASNTTREVASTMTLTANQLHHIAFTITSTTATLYLNGINAGSSTDANLAKSLLFSATDISRLGAGPGTTGYFAGILDEAALWKRALSASEISALYRRGANRVKYQVRSCVDVSCNCSSYNTSGSANDCDGDATPNSLDLNDSYQAQWVGADGTSGSFFSELQSNSSVDASGTPTGTVTTTAPVFDWNSNFFTPSARPVANRYFQYRIFMESDDVNGACATAVCAPEVSSVQLTPQGNYYGAATVTNSAALPYATMQSLVKSDTNACTTYQISIDGGLNWKYYNTTSNLWTNTTDGVAKSNPMSDFTDTRLQGLASGSFKFKAFLSTNAAHTQSCELNSVSATYIEP